MAALSHPNWKKQKMIKFVEQRSVKCSGDIFNLLWWQFPPFLGLLLSMRCTPRRSGRKPTRRFNFFCSTVPVGQFLLRPFGGWTKWKGTEENIFLPPRRLRGKKKEKLQRKGTGKQVMRGLITCFFWLQVFFFSIFPVACFLDVPTRIRTFKV